MERSEAERFEDPKFAGWRDEFECEECRMWTGKPPIPIAQAALILRKQGLSDFKLSHACKLQDGGDGKVRHMPITVLETSDGQLIEWYPELPGGSR